MAVYGTDGVLSETADLTMVGDTLTATKLGAFEATGAIDFGSQAMTNVDIDSGTIDGADVTVGSAMTLDVSAGTLTLANNQLSADKVEGGTLGGALTLGDGASDTLSVASTP